MLGWISIAMMSKVHAEWCFHDAISVVDEPGEISQWANVRNVACMPWSDVIGTLKAGTKVRIIAKAARTKIIFSDGKIGWVGNAFIKSSDNWTNVPTMVENHKADSYCDTTDPTRCPYPSAIWETPTFYTSTASTTSTATTSSTSITLAQKKLVWEMVTIFMNNLEKDYGDAIELKLKRLTAITSALKSISFKPSVKPMMEYLRQKLVEQKLLLLM